MAGKQLDVPHDIVNLKRPALQKLCKQLGLKANGKVSRSREISSQDDVCHCTCVSLRTEYGDGSFAGGIQRENLPRTH